ncbi:MAG: N-acetyltransferase [Prevotellaceae bacterium]|jgi:GNAT superfamily N-acetyltransferase|nr:N-acetyltransferase [Prevotellaceae bacterium]
MIEIKEVKNRCELKKFIKFGTDLYEGNPYFCPPLVFDELNTFNLKKNPAHEVCDHVVYLAYKDGKIVGRIAGIINYRANEHWQNKRVRFGWFDFIDDLEVSKTLLDTVKTWGKERGMNEMNGPVGFTDFDHQGLLIRGFEYNAPMASLYNYEYYLKHFEAYGMVKDADWIEYRVFIPQKVPDKMERVAKIVMEKYKLKVIKVKSARELVKHYGYTFLDVIDTAYQPLYNYQPLTDKQKKYYCDMYFPLLNYDFATIVVNENDEIVGAGCGMPNISAALRKCKGKLFPFGWYGILKGLKTKKIDFFDLLLIAVRPDYQNKGVNALFFYDQTKYFIKYGVQYSETTSILETNSKNQANWEYFDNLQHKRRRAFVIKI